MLDIHADLAGDVDAASIEAKGVRERGSFHVPGKKLPSQGNEWETTAG